MAIASDNASSDIRFSVSYSLREYLSIVFEHLPTAIAAHPRYQGKPRRTISTFDRLLAAPIVSLGFLVKKRRMPVCDFTINDAGIQRVAGGRTLQLPWDEVVAVHRYATGYLVAKKSGAMPLPHRCFTSDDAQAFEGLVQAWRARGNDA